MFQDEDGIRDPVWCGGFEDVDKRQAVSDGVIIFFVKQQTAYER